MNDGVEKILTNFQLNPFQRLMTHVFMSVSEYLSIVETW